MTLTGTQLETVHNALLSCFGSQSEIEMVVRFCLDRALNEVASGETLTLLVFNLLKWTEKQGLVEDLIDGAYKHNPSNAEMQSLLVLYPQWKNDWDKRHGGTTSRSRSNPKPNGSTETPIGDPDSSGDNGYISLTIDRDLESYSPNELEDLILAIRRLLRLTKEVRLVQLEAGSVVVTVKLPQDRIDELLTAINDDQLAQFDIVECRVIEDLTQSPTRVRYEEKVRRESAMALLVGTGAQANISIQRTDQEWLDALRNHKDKDAYNSAYSDLSSYLLTVVNNYLLKESQRSSSLRDIAYEDLSSLADDIVQDSLVNLLTNESALLDSYAGMGSFTSWIAQVTLNDVRADFRYAGWRQSVSVDELVPESSSENQSVSAMLSRIDISNSIQQALNQLPEREQIAIIRCVIEGEPADSVAVDLGMSPNAIYILVNRAKTRLRQLLLSDGIEFPEYMAI